MRRACIDIGSNTTRLLVAECGGDQLREICQERVFTRIGRSTRADGTIPPEKIAEVAGVVARQLQRCHELGATEVRGVATAAIRCSSNREALVAAIRAASGLEIQVLSGQEEARLAFLGAARTLDHPPAGELGVVDVGGGSSELVVGTAPDRISWCMSFDVGSGDLADDVLCSDPPTPSQLREARARVAAATAGVSVPRPAEAVAVGGSATSLCRLAGSKLDAGTLERALALLTAQPSAEVAARFALDEQRVRLLPAALLILQAASDLFGMALQVGCGGIREGVVLEAGR